MITFRTLCRGDVEMLDDHLAADPTGAARITVSPNRWWELVSTDPHRHGWIIKHDKEAIGYLDAQRDTVAGQTRPGAADAARTSGATHLALLLFPTARGLGLAREVLHRALELPELATATTLLAHVESDNPAARRALLSAGFVETGTDPDGLIQHRRPGTTSAHVET